MTDVDDALAAVGLAAHGPVDVTLTVLNWPAESNPLVQAMGLGPWLGFKAVVMSAFAAVYLARIRPGGVAEGTRTALAVFAGTGCAVMVLNLVTLYHGGSST